MRDTVAGIANLLRIHTAGFEGLAFTLGPILAGWSGSFWKFTSLWFIGVLINGYIFTLNDLIDLPYDRANPARTRSPLVDGRVSEPVALALSVCLPLAATAMVMVSRWPASAELPFVFMLALGAVVNLYQKVTRHPLAMDLLFSVTMAAPIPVSAQALTGRLPLVVWLATTALFFLALLLNSVGGNLKDLQSDRRTGFRTVAVSLGADIAPDGALVAGLRYRRYCWGVQAITTSALVLTLVAAVHARPLPEIVGVAVSTILLGSLGARDMHRLLCRIRRPSPRGTDMYFASGFALLLIAVAVRSHLPVFFAALGSLIVWTAGSSVYWQWYWRHGPVLSHSRLET